MKNYHFTVIVQQDEEGNYLAICPALQGCYAEGETPEEALEYLKDAYHLDLGWFSDFLFQQRTRTIARSC